MSARERFDDRDDECASTTPIARFLCNRSRQSPFDRVALVRTLSHLKTWFDMDLSIWRKLCRSPKIQLQVLLVGPCALLHWTCCSQAKLPNTIAPFHIICEEQCDKISNLMLCYDSGPLLSNK